MKMFRCLLVLIICSTVFLSAFSVNGSNGPSLNTYSRGRLPRHAAIMWPTDMIAYNEVSKREEGLEMRGQIPYITDAAGSLQRPINEEIDRVINNKVAEARETRARSLTFDFETFHADREMSIVIKSTATNATSKTTVASVNFNTQTGALLSAEDVVGTHVVQLADRLLLEIIRRNPGSFNPGFNGMRRGQAFSATRDEIVFWFDEFQLKPIADGVVPFTLRRNDILVHTISREQFRTQPGFNFKMVQVREVSEALGYEVHWCPNTSETTIFHNGELVIVLTPGENNYERVNRSTATRTLEAPPELVDERTYVPISFFDQILSLVAYSIDNQENITFASYRVTDAWFEW